MPNDSTHETNPSSGKIDISFDVNMLKVEETAHPPIVPSPSKVDTTPEIDMLKGKKEAIRPKKQTPALRAYAKKPLSHGTSATAPSSNSATLNPTNLFPASKDRSPSHLISYIQPSSSSTPTNKEQAGKKERKAARQKEQEERETRRANALQRGKEQVAYNKVTPTEAVTLEPIGSDKAELEELDDSDFLAQRMGSLLMQENKQRKTEEGE